MMPITLAFLWPVALTWSARHGRDLADESAGQHRAMCELVKAASATYTPPMVAVDAEALKNKVEAANMSLAQSSWKEMFTEDDATNAFNKLKGTEENRAKALAGEVEWENWRRAKKNIQKLKIGTETTGEYPKITNAAQKLAARQHIRLLVLQANKLFNKAKTLKALLTDPSQNKIQQYLTEALYGTGAVAEKLVIGTGTGPSGTTASLCHTSDPRKSIAGHFLCLCGDNTATTNECSKAYAPAALGDQNAINTQWDNLKASCVPMSRTKATPELIHSAIAAWKSALTQESNSDDDNRVYLGSSSDGSCSGAATKTCVLYTKFFKKASGADLMTLPWLKHLTDAAEQLSEAERKEAQLDNALTQLQIIEASASHIYAAAASNTLETVVGSSQLPTAGTEKESATASVPKTDDCKAKKGAGCKDGCKEVEEGGKKKCVVDPNYKKKKEEGANKNGKRQTPQKSIML
uniref:Variant surface glycoprotein 1125.4743 n=1 Tax=Trypanosoma brucei TaxID=5691 RepID=M4SUS3_9TRYP|nr:variant surface glycoprotein 1180 [Trypanosoma brucei]APD74955.1 variant surface glycoprotein 1125.4743 [Trypanosoma brucei]